MLDYAVAFIIGNVWSICFLCAGLYNFYFRKEYKPIIHMSLVLAGTYGLTQIIYSQFIVPQENLYAIFYLYWASACGFVALCLAADHHIKGYVFHWPIKLAIALLLIELFLSICMHIDRNIVALNGSMKPNAQLEDAWWLWTIRNVVVNLDNVFILFSVLIPFRAFRSGRDVYKTEFTCMQMEKAFKRIRILEDIIFIMPTGINKAQAYQCIESAKYLLEQWGLEGENRRHLYSANVLCDRARALALYCDDALEAKLNNESANAIKVDY